jgi:hypothetical protein
VAQTIHELSPRATFPFVAINCSAIPTLLESGSSVIERGVRRKRSAHGRLRARASRHAVPGRDRRDDAGHSGEVARAVRIFRRLGGGRRFRRRARDCRHRVIPQEVNTGKLREDLFYRPNVFAIDLPPSGTARRYPLLVRRFSPSSTGRTEKGFARSIRRRCISWNATHGRGTSVSSAT